MSGIDRPTSCRSDGLFDSSVVREWYAQVAWASKTPGLAQYIVQRTGDLLPRFTAFYDTLRALPRRLRRAIARGRGLSLARVALLLALCGAPLRAATIAVDESSCRLADAIVASNTDSATGGCSAGSGDDLIVLNAGVTLGSDLPEITRKTTIAAGLGSVIDGAGHACIHVGYPLGDVILGGLTVQNCVRPGGAAAYNEADLTVSNCTITGNHATGGFLEGGGGIQNFYGNLVVENTVISGNSATSNGGGIKNSGGSMTIENSTISGNTAAGHGGGIDNYYSAYGTVTDSVISGNGAALGGGVSAGADWNGGFFELRTSTVSGNTADTGAGVVSYRYGTLLIDQSTISGNTASSKGGGLGFHPDCFACYVTVVGTTISGNTAGAEGGGILTAQYDFSQITLSHTLVSGNDAPAAPELSFDPSITTLVNDFNLVGYDGDARSLGFTPGPNDVVPASGVLLADILSPLADNGGPTPTHALVSGSPAIDAIPTSSGNCSGTTDQRGFPRPVGAGCDIGSVENAARPTFGGSVSGLAARQVTCTNKSTGEREREHTSDVAWSCDGLGLEVQSGDKVQTSVTGVAQSNPIVGAVTGITPTTVSCQNVTTGAKVQAVTSASTWDCSAMGLAVTPGDRVSTGATGNVE